MNDKLYILAHKFAMKLGLESHPFEIGEMLDKDKEEQSAEKMLHPKEKIKPETLSYDPEQEALPYEPEDDVDQEAYDHHMMEYLEELDAMDWHELWNEKKELKNIIQEYQMDELEAPAIFNKKLKLVEERLGGPKDKDLGEGSILGPAFDEYLAKLRDK